MRGARQCKGLIRCFGMSEKPFYIVWSPDRMTNPKVSFNGKQQAVDACANMAEKYVGQRFYVMKFVITARAVAEIDFKGFGDE